MDCLIIRMLLFVDSCVNCLSNYHPIVHQLVCCLLSIFYWWSIPVNWASICWLIVCQLCCKLCVDSFAVCACSCLQIVCQFVCIILICSFVVCLSIQLLVWWSNPLSVGLLIRLSIVGQFIVLLFVKWFVTCFFRSKC